MNPINHRKSLHGYPSKTDRVYDILLENIIRRVLLPGENLVERDLAQKLGVSKTPVREALARLEREGLIQGASYHGFSVTELSENDAIEIYDIREIVDGLAARRAAEKVNKEQVKELQFVIQSFRYYVKKNDLKSYNSLDIKFHNLLGAISGNRRLCEMMQRLRDQTRILMTTSVTLTGRAEASLAEHTKILDAIARRDADLADQLSREHIRNVKKAVLSSLKGAPQGLPTNQQI